MIFILAGVLAIAFLVFVHEFGHFVVAKLLGISVQSFTIGYGRPILKVKWGETTYGIGAFPLGGYVKIAGLDPRERELLPEAEAAPVELQPFWKRMLVVAGGPLANVFLAVFLFAAVFMIGVPTPSTVVEKVLVGSPAAKAGIRAEDKIVRVDGKKVDRWEQAVSSIRGTKKKEIEIELIRQGERVTVVTGVTKREGVNFIGVQVKESGRVARLGFLTALYRGAILTGMVAVGFVQALFLIIAGQLPFRPVSPIGIVQVTSQAAAHGTVVFVDFIAFVTIVLGISNLLPIFPLDGGRVLLWTIERVKRSPLKTDTVVVLQVIGIGLLVVLVVMAIYLDIFRPLANPFK